MWGGAAAAAVADDDDDEDEDAVKSRLHWLSLVRELLDFGAEILFVFRSRLLFIWCLM